jgi:general secretion pathway protein E
MSASRHPAAPKAAPLDLQQIYTWLLADGMIRKAEVKDLYAQSQAILKNATAPCIR